MRSCGCNKPHIPSCQKSMEEMMEIAAFFYTKAVASKRGFWLRKNAK
uniref:Uncharacterized protein n=1 Tax=Globisporangium ultimum (strain ATCC 200006 / CBS 805.95 / DAOM BR144) TaxID=431595 RepID=K3WW03_GLOUD